jgi:D-alanine-D-alanine ligase
MDSLTDLPAGIFIWVLAPHLETNDPDLEYYYDFSQSIAEYKRAFEVLKLDWKWQPVTIDNYKSIIDGIALTAGKQTPVVFNLCDGDEVNGTPGISVIRYLKDKKLVYTGAEAIYYHLTTSKIVMKDAFDKAGVSNARWRGITDVNQELAGICEAIGKPVIAKPAVSGGSMGLGVKNVVNSDEELKLVVQEIYKGYRGWDLAFGGIVAEQFIAGPEFTSLIIGSYQHPGNAIIYPPVERIFHPALKEEEKFLSYDRLWETYYTENPIGEFEHFYNYYAPDPSLVEKINQLSWDAYCAVEGTGYGRVDIRQDKETGKLFVLEVNAQCGLSEDENFTSIGAILRLGKLTYANMLLEIINDALQRHTG